MRCCTVGPSSAPKLLIITDVIQYIELISITVVLTGTDEFHNYHWRKLALLMRLIRPNLRQFYPNPFNITKYNCVILRILGFPTARLNVHLCRKSCCWLSDIFSIDQFFEVRFLYCYFEPTKVCYWIYVIICWSVSSFSAEIFTRFVVNCILTVVFIAVRFTL